MLTPLTLISPTVLKKPQEAKNIKDCLVCISIFNLMFPIKAEKMLRIDSALSGGPLVIPPKAPERPRSVADYYSPVLEITRTETTWLFSLAFITL